MIDLSYPYWYLVLCVAIAGLASWVLYYFQKTSLTKSYQLILSVFRFFVVFFICVLILKPIIKYTTTFSQKPIIIIGLDNSESVILSGDSIDYKTDLKTKIDDLKSQFGDKFELKTLLIGGSTSNDKKLTFSEKSTNISSFISYVNDYYSYENLASVYLISDGISNQGSSPFYQEWNPNVPLNTIGVGDSSLNIDQRVIGVRTNSISFLGNKIPVRIDIGANAMSDKKLHLVIKAFGSKPIKDTIPILSNEFTKEVSLLLDATKLGKQKITVEIIPDIREVNITNNIKSIYVNVKDKKQNVLLAFDFPSPDVKAIRSSLEKQDGIEVTLLNSKEILSLSDVEIREKYSVVVAFQLPTSSNNSIQVFDKLNRSNLPIWFVGSGKTNYLKWFDTDPSLSWEGKMNSTNTVNGGLNDDFSLFTFSSKTDVEQSWLPIKVPFGIMDYSAGAQILVNQKIGGIETKDPLWLFTINPDKSKRSYFFGEGIWRWKMAEYQKFENWDLFDELVEKTIQVLAQKKNDSRFRLNLKPNYFESDEVLVRAELFNQSYEAVNMPAVKFILTDTSGLKSEFELDKTNNEYSYNLGSLAKGKYSYKSSVIFEGKTYQLSGEFEVMPMNVEHENLRANFSLLANLAASNGGEFYAYKQWDSMVNDLKEISPTSRSYEEIENKDLIHQKWLFLLLLILASSEWLMRKREGVI